jgi:hypothetical protein
MIAWRKIHTDNFWLMLNFVWTLVSRTFFPWNHFGNSHVNLKLISRFSYLALLGKYSQIIESKSKTSELDPVTKKFQSSKVKLMDEKTNKLNIDWDIKFPTFWSVYSFFVALPMRNKIWHVWIKNLNMTPMDILFITLIPSNSWLTDQKIDEPKLYLLIIDLIEKTSSPLCVVLHIWLPSV